MTAAERRPHTPIRPKTPIPTRTAAETSVRWRAIRWPIRSMRPRIRHGPSVLKVSIDTFDLVSTYNMVFCASLGVGVW